jgi:hypothetical protein
VRTQQRYNIALPIHVQPRYSEQLIFWSNLNAVPAGIEVDGACLVDETGKRYPAWQEIAAHLLAKRHTVIYRRQTTNYYFINQGVPVTTPLTAPPRRGGLPSHTMLQKAPDNLPLSPLEVKVRAMSENAFSTPLEAPPMITLKPPTPIQRQPEANTQPELQQSPVRSKRFYRRPLKDSRMEEVAQQIYSETSANSDGMSIYNARRLVDTYGVEPCEAALKRMIWLQKRNKIANPAGFLVVVSRMMWRLQNGATDLGAPAPRFNDHTNRKRRQ